MKKSSSTFRKFVFDRGWWFWPIFLVWALWPDPIPFLDEFLLVVAKIYFASRAAGEEQREKLIETEVERYLQNLRSK